MAREIERLGALQISRKMRPGLYRDGGGLCLQVTETGAKSWLFAYQLRGQRRQMGLGPLHTVSLAEARDVALDCRRQCRDGVDPIDFRNAERARKALEAAKGMTFKECAEAYIKSHKAGWRNAKHAAQWEATLKTYAYPEIGALSVQAVDTGLVMKVLEPVWSTKPETASRLRGRMESVLDWAKVRSYRDGENPARWRGHLDQLLPARGKMAKVEHHAALPYPEIGDFIVTIQAQEGTAARALEFTILTAARTGETIGATWGEIDLGNKLWTIHAERMKAGKEHRVPLSERAMAVLTEMKRPAGKDAPSDAFVFPGGKAGKPMSNMAMTMTLRRMERDDLTVHGFRSTFRDWAAERTNYPGEVVEMALAHAVGDKIEAAYRRGDLFDKRRRLMAAWAAFCAAPSAKADGNVTRLRPSSPQSQG